MNLFFTLNGKLVDQKVNGDESLLHLLRHLTYFGAKSGGCANGECGACAVLVDGKLVNSCQVPANFVQGKQVVTVESLGENPNQGWKESKGLHPIQQAFIDCGAVQCGYCIPAMCLAARALIEKKPKPTELDVRRAISGVLCRCTGYQKIVAAVLRAAAIIRGEKVADVDSGEFKSQFGLQMLPTIINTKEFPVNEYFSVGQSEKKVDAEKLVQGKPVFTSDINMHGMLYAKVLKSPHAHAKILSINTSKAKALKGVKAVLTHHDLPRVVYSTAGQSDPIPGPLDMFSLDEKVRFVGDRVAFVAAETAEIAEEALKLIDVEYEVLPAILDSSESMSSSTRIHDEAEYVNFADSDPSINLAAKIRIDIGNVDKGFKDADRIFENDYEVPKVQQAHIEPHVALTYWDEDDRLVVRTSTQVPFHARRILAPVLGLPVKKIRVVKPRIGGGFGGKQEILIEDVAAHLTIATGKPVLYEMTREEEFSSSRSRHPMKVHLKTGVKLDGTITANEMTVISDTGAYGCHALTVTGNTGHKSMSLYVGDGKYRKSPNIRFYADVVYTNTPPAGAFRGYGVPQGYWPLERHLESIASEMKLDPIKFRLKNSLRAGELHPFSTAWTEGREPRPEIINTVGLAECVAEGRKAIDWDSKYANDDWKTVKGYPNLRKGIGMALMMQGTAIPYLDMGGASIKMNDDGSFNLLIGATDLGTGSDTVLAQMAAEVIGAPVEDFIVYSSDTDFTPFDKGAYASSTTYISGTATVKAAKIVVEKIKSRAAKMLTNRLDEEIDASLIQLKDGKAHLNGKHSIPFAEIALNSLHHEDQEQIMGVASFYTKVAPPPFAAQFAEVTVDIETGVTKVDHLVMAVDAGRIINPITAGGQIEGGMTQALGYAICEEMTYDNMGKPEQKDLIDYHIFKADEMPKLETIFVQTNEQSHPFGVKAVAEIPMDGVAPAVGNAIYNACGADLHVIPATPERVWRALKGK